MNYLLNTYIESSKEKMKYNMNYTKKVIVTGSNGMLGKDIVVLFKKNKEYEVYGVNRKGDNNLDCEHSLICDITNFDELNKLLKNINPDIIIHCAAFVDVDGCESDKDYAYNMNVISTKILSSFNADSTKFIYISTDSVFDGQDGSYKEIDRTNPLNYYALTKLYGEQVALNNNKNAAVVRANIYGYHKLEGNSLVEWALKNLENSTIISGFNDIKFNPLYTKQLARVLEDVVNNNYNGILHAGCENSISKYEFLIKLSMQFYFDAGLIDEVSVNSKNFNAKRPKNTTLCIDKLKSLINYKLSIEQGLEELYSDYQK